MVPTILDTYQVRDVHIECITIYWMGQSSVIGPHIEAEPEGKVEGCSDYDYFS